MTRSGGEHTDTTYMQETRWDVEQARYPVCDAGVYRAKIALLQMKPDFPMEVEMKAIKRCCSVVSAIAERWHMKFRRVRCA